MKITFFLINRDNRIDMYRNIFSTEKDCTEKVVK